MKLSLLLLIAGVISLFALEEYTKLNDKSPKFKVGDCIAHTNKIKRDDIEEWQSKIIKLNPDNYYFINKIGKENYQAIVTPLVYNFYDVERLYLINFEFYRQNLYSKIECPKAFLELINDPKIHKVELYNQ